MWKCGCVEVCRGVKLVSGDYMFVCRSIQMKKK